MAANQKRLNLILEGQLTQVVEKSKIRLFFLISAVFLTFLAIAGQTIKLTFFLDAEFKKKYLYSSNSDETVFNRPKIYDRNGTLISSNLKTASLYANPRIMIDKEDNAKKLSEVLPELKESDLIKKFNSDKAFIWLKRNLHPKQKYDVNALGNPGLLFREEEKRIYPHGNIFSHVIGMTGVDGDGLTGFERHLDNIKHNNTDIVTSLDLRVQNVVREEVLKQKIKHKATRAVGIVLDVTNGEVLSLSSLPDYDPNIPKSINRNSLFNAATLGTYEMGSTFKPLTFAIGFEENKIKMWSSFDASNPIKISRFTISDFHARKRRLSVPEILMYSSNIGTAKIAERIGAETMQKYFHKIGFYEKLGIEIAEKSRPIAPRVWRDATTLTASFGHGFAVSPMHIAAAFASTINGGVYYPPTIIKSDKKVKGKKIFSKKTSDKMRKLIRLVVSNKEGSGKKANAEGYFVGGKTGTAEKLDTHGNYKKKSLVSSFIGVFPMTKPKYLVLVLLDEPKGTKDTWGFATGGWVAAPAVKNIIERIAPILKVKPIDKNNRNIKEEFKVKYEL